MGAAEVLMLARRIRNAIRVHGFACASFTFGLVAIRLFFFGRCKRCARYSEKSRKRKRDADLRNHDHFLPLEWGKRAPSQRLYIYKTHIYTTAPFDGPPISRDKVLL